jgi:hypothetical protein
VGVPFEHGNGISGFIKCWEFLEWLSDLWLLKSTRLHGVSSLAFLLFNPIREGPVFAVRVLVSPVSN